MNKDQVIMKHWPKPSQLSDIVILKKAMGDMMEEWATIKTSPQKKKHHRAKEVIDISTGKTYPSAADAAKEFGCSETHMRNQLNGNVPNKTSLRYAE